MEGSAKLPADQLGSGNMMADGVQTPGLDKSGKVTRPAFRDGAQAWSIWTALENDNRVRTSMNAEIVARHNGKPPHDPKELQQHLQGWRSNFPTLALAGIESRITARLVNTIDNLRVLTNSALPESFDDHDEKSKRFQKRITSYVREWSGWRPFISALWTEDVLIGYAVAALLDDYNWRPHLFRSDEGFLPQGSPQHPRLIQISGFKQSFMIHEAVQWIEHGKEVSEVAGFQFQEVIDSINVATPKNPLWDQPGQGNVSRAYQDLVREGNLGQSYSTGAKGINVAHLLGVEPDTREVTHYIIDRDNAHNALFIKKNRFTSMEDVVCLFTLEPGNSTYYGSKGIGRKTVNICAAIDICANDRQDARKLAGMRILKSTAQGGIANHIRMTNPFVIVTTDADLQTETFGYDAEGYNRAMAELQQILENAVGEYISNIPGDPQDPVRKDRTATAERIDFQREQEQSIAFIARGLGQFFSMMQPIQRRLCDPETDDEDAKQCQKELQELDGLSPEEIAALAKANTAEVVQDLAAKANQQMDLIAQKYMNSPFVNQLKLVRHDIAGLSSPQIADDLILPNQVDPNEQAEQWRAQVIENVAMQNGEPMNIARRDNDKIHLDSLIKGLNDAAPRIAQKQITDPDLPQIMDNLNMGLRHGDAHVDQWVRKLNGKKTPMTEHYRQILQGHEKNLTKMAHMLQRFKQQQQMAQTKGLQQAGPGGFTPQPGMQPPGIPGAPNGQTPRESISIAYKDAPPSIQRQMEAAAGFQPATDANPPTTQPIVTPPPNQTAAPRPGSAQTLATPAATPP